MRLYVVRHAQAGKKSEWSGDDHERPLSPRGFAQAAELCRRLPKVRRLIVSPTVRCHQTLQPLADRLGIEIETSEALSKTTSTNETIALLDELVEQGRAVAVCSHGEVLGPLLRELESGGTRLLGGPGNQKASVWTIKADHGAMLKATYQHPPVVKGRK